MSTVWIYIDTSKEVGDVDHLKVFPNADAARERFRIKIPGSRLNGALDGGLDVAHDSVITAHVGPRSSRT
jgi:hypothetical protein